MTNTAILEALGEYFKEKLTQEASGEEVYGSHIADALAAAVAEVRSFGPKRLVRFKTQQAFEEMSGKQLKIEMKNKKIKHFVLVDDSQPAPQPSVSLSGVFRIHDLDSEIEDKHVLAFFKQADVQLANDERLTREYYSNRFLGGERILNGVRRFKGTWLLHQTQAAVDRVGVHELTIDNEKHQMRVEMVGGPRRCYVCGQFGHVAAAHGQSRGSTSSWAARASGQAIRRVETDNEEGEIESDRDEQDEEQEELMESAGTRLPQHTVPAPSFSVSAPNPNLVAANFPVLQTSQVSSNNIKTPFAIPNSPAPPAHKGALKSTQPQNARPSRKSASSDKQSDATPTQSASSSRRTSRTSSASGRGSRDASASETMSDNKQTAVKSKLKQKRQTVGKHLADAHRSGLESTESTEFSPTERAAKKHAFEENVSVNVGSAMQF